MRARTTPARPAASEEGSAYLTVLLLLVVLTIVGLSVAVITQSEVFIGGNEKQSTRQLFAAGSAAQISAAYELVSHDPAGRRFTIGQRNENILGTTTTIGDRVCTTPMLPLHAAACNLCLLNEDNEFAAVQYGVTSTALRFGDLTLGARRTIGTVIAFEPYRKDFTGLAVAGERPLKDVGDVDVDPSTEIDPCEGLFSKI
ncbi:MAG: hypothetical protein AB7G12_04380 [Thermoanaerobaculia bacterium]